MLQLGQNLPLLAESLPKQVGGKGQVDQFDGDLLLELPVGAMRQIDGAHAAAAQQAVKLVGPDSPSIGLTGPRPPSGPNRRDAVRSLFRLAGLEQRTHLGCEFMVLMALGLDQCLTRVIGSGESLVEDRLNPQKSFRRLVHRSDNPVGGL